MKHVDIVIRGMSCGHCVASVRRALESVEGVAIDRLNVGSASVRHDDKVSPADLIDRIREAGYDATVTLAEPH